MPELEPYNAAIIKNSSKSTQSIRVCRDWSTKSCNTSSAVGYLAPGEDSRTKFTWFDTDGFDLGDGWVKEHGCFGCVVTVTAR